MWAIYNEELDVFASIRDDCVDWHKSCCDYDVFETEEDAIDVCIEYEIDLDFVVEL